LVRSFIKRIIVAVTQVVAAIMVIAALIIFTHPGRKYDRLNVGMTASQAISVMESAPRRTYTTEGFCATYRKTTLYSVCDELVSRDTAAFMVWNVGIDTVIVVGLDQEASVSFLGIRDT
jgi:hypothetical protein